MNAGRAVCERCWRPEVACYCAAIRPVATTTRVVVLQHPRERYVPIGTARMATLCLPNSELHIGIDWSRSQPLARALANTTHSPILLYPGEGARDIVRDPPPGPVTLVVVDGTWSQARKVVRSNPILDGLPRYAFEPNAPSNYRIRREPAADYVATIEALVHALSALEGPDADLSPLLAPFTRMVDFQLECIARRNGGNARHAKFRSRPRRQGVPRILTDRFSDLVCIAAEANAWPHPRPGLTAYIPTPRPADELVHFAAHRPATGETLSFVVAPRGEVAPGTTRHTDLDQATLQAGGLLDELHSRFAAFSRPTDIVCAWGIYEPELFVASGGVLPEARLDLRHVARGVARQKIGRLSEVLPAREGFESIPGRAGRKLHAIAEIVASFVALPDALPSA